MVGADHIDNAALQAAPETGAVIGIAHGRVHLGPALDALVDFRTFQRQVLRRGLDRGDIAVLFQNVHLLRRRDVEDVDPLAGLAGQTDEAFRRQDGGFGIALEKDVDVSMEANRLDGNREPQTRIDGVVLPFPDETESDPALADEAGPDAAADAEAAGGDE